MPKREEEQELSWTRDFPTVRAALLLLLPAKSDVNIDIDIEVS